jgi:hypothetical protein
MACLTVGATPLYPKGYVKFFAPARPGSKWDCFLILLGYNTSDWSFKEN